MPKDDEDLVSADVWEAVNDSSFGRSPMAVRVTKAGELVRVIRLEADMTYIGRMPENHVVVDDPMASRSHARIRDTGQEIVIEDQKSHNGLFVNGKKVERHKLIVGDTITIGEHTLEIIHASDSVQGAAREHQIEKAEDEEWRIDQTVSLSSDELQKKYASGVSPKPKEHIAPKLHFTFTIGSDEIEKEIVFQKGRKRKDPDGKPNAIEIKIAWGVWVLEKRLILD